MQLSFYVLGCMGWTSVKPSANERRGRMLMKILVLAVAVVTMALTSAAGAHGGGCRKSSPPGQCCHMDNSAGSVHCH